MAKNDEVVTPDVPEVDDVPNVEEAGGDSWYPDLPRVAMDALYGRQIVVLEINLRDSTFEEGKKYALIRLSLIDKAVKGTHDDEAVDIGMGDECTTMTGSGRIVDQLRRVTSFPIKGEVARYTTRNQRIIPELKPIK